MMTILTAYSVIIRLNRPALTKNIENELLARKYIMKKGIKYFRKVSAVGESTAATLKRISRSPYSKMIFRLQFDP